MRLKTMAKAAFLAAAFLVAGCATPKDIAYFQDLKPGSREAIAHDGEITFMPEDKLSIVVSSRDPQLADMFNLTVVSHRVGYTQTSTSLSQGTVSCYTVDSDGNIDFPVLGKVSVAGFNRDEVAEAIKAELVDRQLVNDPVVTVEFAGLYVSVLGEVNRPGRYTIDRDHLTLLDAIGMAGDLTIYGTRKDVVVMREEAGKSVSYQVDLTSAYDLYESPAYYLQQKDVVYVRPNDARARQSTVNGNNVRSTSFWLSLASVLTSMAVLIVNATN